MDMFGAPQPQPSALQLVQKLLQGGGPEAITGGTPAQSAALPPATQTSPGTLSLNEIPGALANVFNGQQPTNSPSALNLLYNQFVKPAPTQMPWQSPDAGAGPQLPWQQADPSQSPASKMGMSGATPLAMLFSLLG